MKSLSPKVIQSGFWSLGGNWLTRGLGIIKMVVLARLLSPIDFGILGLATLSINFFTVFSETGIESALIQKDKISRNQLDTAWTIGLVRGLILCFLLILSAGWLAAYFENSTLESVLKIMAVVFVLGGFVNIGLVYFQRELEFQKKVKLDFISDFVGAVTAIILAFWLKNVWALVLGSIAWGITKTLSSYCMHPYRPRLYLDLSIAKNLLNFGKHIFWIAIVTFIVTCGDDAIVGKLLGLSTLGYYMMAYNIANIPVSSLAGIIGNILFPAFSKLQHEPVRLSEALKKVIELVLIILLPVTVLVMLLAKDFTSVFFGDKWLPMVPALQILSLLGLFRGLVNVFSPIQLALNRPDIQSRNKTLELIILLLLIYPLTNKWGLVGASWAVTLVYFTSAIINIISTAHLIPSFYLLLLKALWFPLIACSVLILSTWWTHSCLNAFSGIVQFAIAGLSGIFVYTVATLIIRKNLIKEIFISFCEVKA